MLKKSKHIFIYLIVMFLSITVFANENKSKPQIIQETVVKKFIEWDKQLNTLDTFYEQETSFEGTLISKTFGHLIKLGQNIRLETLEEGKITQYALTDKEIIHIFNDKGNMIMQMPWESWQKSQQNKTLFDFGNYEKILENHKIEKFEISENGYLLVLTPKEGEVYTLSFLLNKHNFFPKEINLSNEGVTSKTTLQKTKINKNVSKEIFK